MENNKLVQRGELDQVLATLIDKQSSVIADIDRCLPLMTDEDLIKKLSIQKVNAEAQLKALQEGYVPIVGGFFWNIDTKSKWGKHVVKDIMDTMPVEVKGVLEEVKESGVFKAIKVTGQRRGDPMLVGSAGGHNFLLAMWANLEGGYAIGFITRGKRGQ